MIQTNCLTNFDCTNHTLNSLHQASDSPVFKASLQIPIGIPRNSGFRFRSACAIGMGRRNRNALCARCAGLCVPEFRGKCTHVERAPEPVVNLVMSWRKLAKERPHTHHELTVNAQLNSALQFTWCAPVNVRASGKLQDLPWALALLPRSRNSLLVPDTYRPVHRAHIVFRFRRAITILH